MSILPDGFPMVSMKWFAAVLFVFVLSPFAAAAAQVVQTGGTEAQAQQLPCLPEDEPCGGGGTPGISVTPDNGGTFNVTVGQSNSATFIVTNTGTTSGLITTWCDYSVTNIQCTGSTVNGVPGDNWSSGPGQADTLVVSYSALQSGTFTLRLTGQLEPGPVSDQGTYTVVATGVNQAPTVALERHSADGIDRGLCFTTGAGEAAGVGCGDLFVTHGLPSYRSMGRDRSLTLVYNSAASSGLTLVAAKITQQVGTNTPTKVIGILTIGTAKDSAEFLPISGGESRQIVLGRNLIPPATGIYTMTLTVRNVFPGGVYDATTTSRVVVVNHSGSEYGRGWRLSGVERLLFGQPNGDLLWLAGEGSAQVYGKLNDSTWVAPSAEFRDTVRYVAGTTPKYTRYLRHGVKVVYNAAGYHTETINRLNLTTTFVYGTVASQTRLTAIQLPGNDAATRQYTLHYDGTTALLDSIRDPVGRRLRVQRAASNAQDSVFTDPDGQQIFFQYGATHLRMTGRKRPNPAVVGGYATTLFDYTTNTRVTLVRVPRDSAQTQYLATMLTPWDGNGLATAATGNVPMPWVTGGFPTQVDGPITGTSDRLDILVDKYGQPLQTTVTGTGAVTTITRGDANFPAMVTRVQSPLGQVTRLFYNSRGNLTQQLDTVPSLPTRSTRWTYGDANTPDGPTIIRDTLGRQSTYTYTSLGLTASVTDPTSHQTGFAYTAKGLLDSVVEYAVPVWVESSASTVNRNLINKFTYDGQGSVRTVRGPNGVVSTSYADSIGRAILSWDPYNTLTRTTFDVMNRTTRQTLYANAQSNPYVTSPRAGCVTTEFICADSTQAWRGGMVPDSLVTKYFHGVVGVDSIQDPRAVHRGYRYGPTGAPVREVDEAYQSGITYFGVFGLVDSVKSRSGRVVRYRYDNVGRRTAMIYAARAWPVRGEGNAVLAATIPGDSVSYTYDIVGNPLQIRNNLTGRGITTRTYYADGSPRTRVVTYPLVDTLEYWYDATGALSKKYHVTWDNLAVLRDTTYFHYAASTGALDSMVVKFIKPFARTQRVAFTWDPLGRRASTTYQTGHTVTYAYDALGTMRQLRSGSTPCAYGQSICYVRRNKDVDAIGRVLFADETCFGDETASTHSCQNMASSQGTRNKYYRAGWLATQQVDWKTDSMEYDGSGNIRRRYMFNASGWHRYALDLRSNRIDFDTAPAGGVMAFTYTLDGDRDEEDLSAGGGTEYISDRYYFYDGLGRTSGLANWLEAGGGYFSLVQHPDDCRYGPDGEQTHVCSTQNAVIYEGANPVATNMGMWHFISGPGIDDPVLGFGMWIGDTGTNARTKLLYFITDGGGRQYAVADTTGVFDLNIDVMSGWFGWKQAGATNNSHSFGAARSGSSDVPNMSFFRNRAYDQRTGMWTQEDPMGVAGGINLYQYSGNNPVMFTDPFGLCLKETATCPIGAQVMAALGQKLSAAAARITGGAQAGIAALGRRAPESKPAAGLPDPGRIDYSVTGNVSIVSVSVGTNGVNFAVGNNGMLSAGVTADATYTRPNPASGPSIVLGGTYGAGLQGGGTVALTPQGRFKSATVSAGYRWSLPLPGGATARAIDAVVSNVGIQ